ncbi:MAG: threonine ammonia-lyase [Capsulimonas sp.]|uniref:threonine ammonia-lyase n=1 Tax=Capsulimonas sp. TaxID=2494211 RepID=UPI0032675FBE
MNEAPAKTVVFEDIIEARARIAGAVYYSPCPHSVPLSEVTGADIYCKLDYLQRTGSFKERGARNALMQLTPEQRVLGVVAASAGNHALGLAYHGQLLGITVNVVMPKFAPLVKVSTCRRLGANVILFGDDFTQARDKAMEMSRTEGKTYVPGFDDAAIVAGQGTMGLEILEQVPDVDAIVVPIGGAGLIAGIALAVKTLRPEVRIIGVEPVNSPSFAAAMAAGHTVAVPSKATVADGLAVPELGALPFEIARHLVDEVVSVTEDELALAILRLAELEKAVVEGAGSAPLAACLAQKIPWILGKKVVLTLCGGNIDPSVLCRVIEKGLVADGRLCRFTASISDKPGGLSEFTALVASSGASVKEITHERAFAGGDVSAVQVLCVVETQDREHIRRLYNLLREKGVVFYQPRLEQDSSTCGE